MRYIAPIFAALLLVGCSAEPAPDQVGSQVHYVEVTETGLVAAGVVTPGNPESFAWEPAEQTMVVVEVRSDVGSDVSVYSDSDPDTPLEFSACVSEPLPDTANGAAGTVLCAHFGAANVTFRGNGPFNLEMRATEPGIGTTPQ